MHRLLAATLAMGVVLAGCATTGDDDTAYEQTEAQKSSQSEVEVVYEAVSREEYCVVTTAGGPPCTRTSPGTPTYDLPMDKGRPLRLAGEVVWRAESEDAEQFFFALYIDPDEEWRPDYSVRGTSPLKFDWDLSVFSANATFGLYGFTEGGVVTDPLSVEIRPGQNYSVNATLYVTGAATP